MTRRRGSGSRAAGSWQAQGRNPVQPDSAARREAARPRSLGWLGPAGGYRWMPFATVCTACTSLCCCALPHGQRRPNGGALRLDRFRAVLLRCRYESISAAGYGVVECRRALRRRRGCMSTAPGSRSRRPTRRCCRVPLPPGLARHLVGRLRPKLALRRHCGDTAPWLSTPVSTMAFDPCAVAWSGSAPAATPTVMWEFDGSSCQSIAFSIGPTQARSPLASHTRRGAQGRQCAAAGCLELGELDRRSRHPVRPPSVGP